MPFGLRNKSQKFERFIDWHGLDFVFVYIDNVLVTSSGENENLRLSTLGRQWKRGETTKRPVVSDRFDGLSSDTGKV